MIDIDIKNPTDQQATYMAWLVTRKDRVTEKYCDPITGESTSEDSAIKGLHKLAITGTMAAVLLGVSPWKTKQELYDEIVNIEDPEVDDQRRFTFEIGHTNEKMIAREFARLAHRKVSPGVTDNDKTRIWSFAQVDFLTDDGCPLEIKTSSHAEGWGQGCLFNDNGVPYYLDLHIPEYYELQVQKQLYITGKDHGWLAVWMTFERGIRVYFVARNPEKIEKIIKAEDDFLFNHVIPEKPFELPPTPLAKAPESEKQNSCFANQEFEALLKRYKELKAPYLTVPAAVKKELAEIQSKIKGLMGDAKYAINEAGQELCHFTESVGKPYFDQEAFSNDHPDLYAKYLRDGKTSTKFFLAKDKKNKGNK